MEILAGRYELTELLAGGGMGKVWRGRDTVLQRTVAVKTVELDGQDQTMKERFRREAVATAGLSTPQVVQVFDTGFDGGRAFLVMELLTGPSLAEKISAEGALSVAEGLRVAREISRGLIAAHRIGVVHRDIKPGNVMYHNDQIKLVDFGIAQLSENQGATLTAPATALGTAAYMSPEQANGRGATPATDWYALGCLMMTMFTGNPPFSGEALAVASQQINAEPPRLSERRSGLPPALDDLVAALLVKDPTRRPTGEQVLDQLRAVEADPDAATMVMTPSLAATQVMSTRQAPALARTPTEPEEYEPRPAPVAARPYAEPAPRRNLGWLWIVALVLALAGGIAAAAMYASGRPAPVLPTPTSSATSTKAPSSQSRPSQSQRPSSRPPSTQPPTTQPPTTQAPTPQPPTTKGDDKNDDKNAKKDEKKADKNGDDAEGARSNNGNGNAKKPKGPDAQAKNG